MTTEIRVPEVAPCQYYEGPVSGRSSMLPEPCITAHTCRIAYNNSVSKTGQTFSGRYLPDDRECSGCKIRRGIILLLHMQSTDHLAGKDKRFICQAAVLHPGYHEPDTIKNSCSGRDQSQGEITIHHTHLLPGQPLQRPASDQRHRYGCFLWYYYSGFRLRETPGRSR